MLVHLHRADYVAADKCVRESYRYGGTLSQPNKTPGSPNVKKMRPIMTVPFPPFNVHNSIENH